MAYSGFGSVMKLACSPGSNDGTLSLFYLNNYKRSSFDNIAFADDHRVVFVEDAGDMLDTQRGAFAYVLGHGSRLLDR